MSVSRLLFLGGNRPWLEVLDAAITHRGEGYDLEWREGERLVAVAPASEVVIHWLDLPNLSLPQANAAARLMLADRILGDVHLASGEADESGTRPVAVVSTEAMRLWTEELQPDAIVPAQMILAAPEDGFICASLGPETVVRGRHVAIADDPELTPLLTGNEEIAALDVETIEYSALAALVAPPLDLRQGPFAIRRSWLPDLKRLRPLAWMAAALALVSLAIPLTRLAKLSIDTNRIEAQTAEVARAAMGEAVAADEAGAALASRLSAIRGGGGGFTGTSAAVIAGVSATPNVEIATLAFASDGVLRMSARAASQAELDALVARLRDSGLTVTPGVASLAQGRPTIELEVRGR